MQSTGGKPISYECCVAVDRPTFLPEKKNGPVDILEDIEILDLEEINNFT